MCKPTTIYAESKQDRAIQDYGKVIQLNPNLADAYFNKASVCEEAKRFREAVIAHRKFIEPAPQQNTFYIQQARAKIEELEEK